MTGNCTRCGQDKPAADMVSEGGRLTRRCKACAAKWRREYNARTAAASLSAIPTERECTTCERVLPRESFYIVNGRLRGRCKDCHKGSSLIDLYRLFDSSGTLLYVGISLSALQRGLQHRRLKDWWVDVSRMEIQHFSSRRDAEAAECQAIRSERPRYNVQHMGAA